jgi:hypothetical protein
MIGLNHCTYTGSVSHITAELHALGNIRNSPEVLLCNESQPALSCREQESGKYMKHAGASSEENRTREETE